MEEKVLTTNLSMKKINSFHSDDSTCKGGGGNRAIPAPEKKKVLIFLRTGFSIWDWGGRGTHQEKEGGGGRGEKEMGPPLDR